MKVAVLGGGMAGLCSAYKLSQEGVEVVVLEKEPTIGGRIVYCGAVTTEKFQPRLNELIKELELEELRVLISQKEESFYTKEREFVGFESFVKLLYKELGIRGMISFIGVASFVDKISFNPLEPDPKLEKYRDISFAEYLDKECPGRISDFVKMLATLFIYEEDLSKISAEYGLCHFRWGNELATGKAYGFEENHLLTVTNILGRKIEEKGGEILTSATATLVEKQEKGFKISYNHKGEDKEMIADKVVMATSLNVSEEIFPELEIKSDVRYAVSKSYFVEGELKLPERKFILGLPENPSNLRALFNVFPYMQMVYPRDADQPIKLDEFYNEYRIIEEKELSPAFSIFPPSCKFPEIKASVEGAYLCGDFYIYPTLESAVLSGEKAAEYILDER